MGTKNPLVQAALDATADVEDLTAPPESVLLVEIGHVRVLRQAAQLAQDTYDRLVTVTEQSQLERVEYRRLERRTRRLMHTCLAMIGITAVLIMFHLAQILGLF